MYFTYLPILYLISFICIIILSFFSLLKEILLKKEVSQLSSEYKIIEQKIKSAERILEDLQIKDENIYRIILNTKSINDDIRQAGFGGVDKYKDFEKYKSTDLIIDISKKQNKL